MSRLPVILLRLHRSPPMRDRRPFVGKLVLVVAHCLVVRLLLLFLLLLLLLCQMETLCLRRLPLAPRLLAPSQRRLSMM